MDSTQKSDTDKIIEERVFSANPCDWDTIADLNMNYEGYFLLPLVYLNLRNYLPTKEKQTFFLDGMFITAEAGETAGDVYLKYEDKKKTNPVYKSWLKQQQESLVYNIHRNKWSPLTEPFEEEPNAIENAIKQITPIFLTKLQPKILSGQKLSEKDLYATYKEAIFNNQEIEKVINFKTFISNPYFANGIANWSYTPKIKHLIQNDLLTEYLKERFHYKLIEYRERESEKFYKKYQKYIKHISPLNKKDAYELKLNKVYYHGKQDALIESTENLTILKKDLFNYMSPYNINNIINTVCYNKHMGGLLKNLTISSGKKNYQILFVYKQENDDKNYRYFKTINQKNELIYLMDKIQFAKLSKQNKLSIFSTNEMRFIRLAKWHRNLKSNSQKMK